MAVFRRSERGLDAVTSSQKSSDSGKEETRREELVRGPRGSVVPFCARGRSRTSVPRRSFHKIEYDKVLACSKKKKLRSS